jgi:protein-disulfide isomerase
MTLTSSLRTGLALALGLVLLAGCSPDSGSAQIATTPDMNSPVVAAAASERAQRILENLKYEIPQLRQLPVIMGDVVDGTVAGLDRGTFMVQGQTYHYIVTEDDSQLFMLAAPAIDASRSADDLAAAYEEEQAAEARAAEETATALAEASSTLPSLGPADAPVTIVEFSDFQCPFCRRAQPTVKQLLAQYPTQVRLAYAHYPLPNHPWARPAAIATECAASQDPSLFWTLHDAYFENQGQLNPGNVLEFTRTHLSGSGIDLTAWNTCATDTASEGNQAAVGAIEAQMELGQRLDLSGTPAFFVNGTLLSGAKPLEEFVQAVEAALSR